ncbi:MAG TPA: SPFH domain-containing protein, partial [Thermoplasmata archaeon]|nr:SPFH domain-containing protein [Thermoplasmata archaeon]
ANGVANGFRGLNLDPGTTILLGLLLLIVAVIIGLAFYANRYKKVPPDKAMVVYGRKIKEGRAGYQVITGGGKFIVPIVEAYEFLPLEIRTLDVVVEDIVTDVRQSGAKLNIKAVAQVRISDDMATLRTAAAQLLHKRDPEINEIALKTLEGHVRGICATLTIEQINSERDAIASQIQGLAANDLKNIGMEIRSFVIKEIEDAHGYLDALGVKRTEEVKRDARIGKANANREATVAEASAAQQAEKANADAEAQVALYHRDRDITVQQSEGTVEIERANKEISFSLQTAKRQQELVVEQKKIDIRAKEQEVLVQQQEVRRKEQEQTAEQIVPAKAKADALAAEADGERRRLIAIAEGEKERLSRVAMGEAERIRQEGTAQADIIRLTGEAQAYAIKAKGLAEAEAMTAKAQAWEMYGRAAVTQLIVEKLPEIVGNAAKSLEGTSKLIIMGERGPSSLVGSVVDIAAQAPALVKALTGMELSELAGKLKDVMK